MSWCELARRAGHSKVNAEDVVQDAMVVVLEQMEYFDRLVETIDALEGVEPTPPDERCGPDTECHDVRKVVYWYARIQRWHAQKERAQYTRLQLRDLFDAGWNSSLPGWDELIAIELRVDVQKAVDSVPNVSPSLVWRYLQGETLRDIAGSNGGDIVKLGKRLQAAWTHCRERLHVYGEGRRHWGSACAG